MKKNLKLSDIPKHQVHQVPEGYFDQLPMRIMERTAVLEQLPAVPWHALFGRLARFAVAPLLLLLLFAGVYIGSLHQPLTSSEAITVASLSDAEIVQYLDAYAQVETMDLEEHMVADQLVTSDFLNVSPAAAEEELEYYPLDELDY